MLVGVSGKTAYMKKLLLIWLMCWSWCACALELGSAKSGALLTPHLQYLEDPQGHLTLADVMQPDVAARFRVPEHPQQALNFGISKSAYWVRFSLQRAPDNTDPWLIELSYALLNKITFYAPGAKPIVTGSEYPVASRAFFDKYFVFPIQPSERAQDYYFRVESNDAITLPLRAWTERDLIPRTQQTLAIQFSYLGAMMGLALYTLFMCVLSRDMRYAIYAAYVVCMALSMTSGSGVARLFFWPDVWKFDSVARNFFVALAASLILYLSGLFLKTEYGKKTVAWGWKLASLYFGAYALLLLSSLAVPMPVDALNKAMLLGGLLSGFGILVTVFRVIRERRNSLRFFGLSWLVFWVGGFVGIGRTMGLLPTHLLTSYAVQIASMAEMVLLFLALADQFRQEQHQRRQAQQEVADVQARLLEQLQSSNEQLEQTVHERTQQMQQALEHERAVSAQYMRFGAMVSHEFRNPLGIIKSQISLLHKEQKHGELQLDKRLSVLGSATERLAMLFEKWLQNDRLHHTLQDIDLHPVPLRHWLTHFVSTNVHCLVGSPVQLRSMDIDAQLLCDEYLLDIALGNLIDNARKYTGAQAPVVIDIRYRPGQVGVAVIDQGSGIAPENQEKVFDEYFRISPQSGISGAGLGLSLVRRIMQAHSGTLELQSLPGQGCTFILWFPEKQAPVH